MKGTDRPPPDQEWFGLFEPYKVVSVETLDQMLDRKFWLKNKLQSEYDDSEVYWNEECRKAVEKTNDFIKKLSCSTTTDTTTVEESCSAPFIKTHG